MAVAFRAAGSNVANITNQTLSLVAPTCYDDDILIACIINKELSVAISPPDSSWTQIYQANGDCTTAADDHRSAIFWKRASTEDRGKTFNFTKASGTVLFMGNISSFSGCNPSNPIDTAPVGATVTAAANDLVTFPSFDPLSDQAHVIFVAFYGNDLTTFAAALSVDVNPDCTKRFDNESASGNDASIALASGLNDGSPISSLTWASVSTTDAGSTGVVFALIPKPVLFNNFKGITSSGSIMSVTERTM